MLIIVFRNCIIQHLMSVKLCFYCKTFISTVRKLDGTIIFEEEALPELPADLSVMYGPEQSESSRPEETAN